LLCGPGWPHTHDLPASVLQVLESQMYVTMTSPKYFPFFKISVEWAIRVSIFENETPLNLKIHEFCLKNDWKNKFTNTSKTSELMICKE
jgi:hypothetical protein